MKKRSDKRKLISLDQFTDEVLRSRYSFGRETITYLAEILKNDLAREKSRKEAVAEVFTTSCNIICQYKTWTTDCGLNIRTMLYELGQLFIGR